MGQAPHHGFAFENGLQSLWLEEKSYESFYTCVCILYSFALTLIINCIHYYPPFLEFLNQGLASWNLLPQYIYLVFYHWKSSSHHNYCPTEHAWGAWSLFNLGPMRGMVEYKVASPCLNLTWWSLLTTLWLFSLLSAGKKELVPDLVTRADPLK